MAEGIFKESGWCHKNKDIRILNDLIDVGIEVDFRDIKFNRSQLVWVVPEFSEEIDVFLISDVPVYFR